MSNFRDRSSRPVSRADMMTLISEAVLANVIAFDTAGVLRDEMKIVVGADGGTIMGKGLFFQTPVTERLSDEEGHLLFNTFAALLEDYDEGRLQPARLTTLRTANRVDAKIESIRAALTE